MKLAGAGTLAPLVDEALAVILTRVTPPELAEASRYAVMPGGKRFRPALTLLACQSVSGDPRRALPIACAIELVHAYSLVHDDLPCLDDAPMRRGKPSCHKAFGEAQALLAGDALLTLAFEHLTEAVSPPALAVNLIGELARAAGHAGMVGGQWDDLKGSLDPDHVATRKTGALIRCSLICGGLSGNASAAQLSSLDRLGIAMGQLYQVTDDILDVSGTPEELGKMPGRDAAVGRRTVVSELGMDGALAKAEHLARVSEAEAEALGPAARPLADLVRTLHHRTS